MSFKEKFKHFFNTEEEYEYIEEVEAPSETSLASRNPQQNVVNLTKIERSTAKVILYEPRSYQEVQEIADNLLNNRSVVINLHKVDRQQAKRIVDFLSGTVYAIKGDIQKLGLSTFLCTPENVEVTGEISVDSFVEEEF